MIIVTIMVIIIIIALTITILSTMFTTSYDLCLPPGRLF